MNSLSKTIEEQKERARDFILGVNHSTDDVWHTTIYDGKARQLNQITEQTSHAILKAVVEELEGNKQKFASWQVEYGKGYNQALSDIQTIINNVIEGK